MNCEARLGRRKTPVDRPDALKFAPPAIHRRKADVIHLFRQLQML
jgi:hypothetical protein